MAEERTFRVRCRMLIEGHIDIPATSKGMAREKVLTLLSEGLDVLPQIEESSMIGHDAEEKRDITELLSGEPIAVKKVSGG